MSKADETIDLMELLGTTGDDSAHLMNIAAWSIWSLGTEGLEGSTWGSSTLLGHFKLLRNCTAWMHTNGKARWDSLSGQDVQDLKVHLYHLDQASQPAGPSTREHLLVGLTAMYVLRERGSMPDGLAHDPRIDDALCVKRVIENHRRIDPGYVDKLAGSTKAIPWLVGQDLVKTAIDLVEHPLAATIVSMAAALHKLRHDGNGSPVKGSRLRLAAEKLYRSWKKSDIEREVLAQFAIDDPSDIKVLFRDIVIACWIIIALFAALRLEEAASLSFNTCVELRNDGHWLVGPVRKTSPELEGSVVPLPVPPIVASAVSLAKVSTAHHRSGGEQLLIFEDDGKNEIVLKSGFAAHCMRRFAARRCRTTAARTFPYASHQLRKLFVQLFVRRFEGRVEDVQQHLRHVNAAMIEEYTSDPELIRMISEEQAAFAGELMLAVMHGTEAATGVPANAWRANGAKYAARTLTPKQAASLAARHEVSVQPTSIGYCVGGSQMAAVAACGFGSNGLPDRAQAKEATCLGCARGLSMARHLPMLKASYVVHQQVVESKDVAGPLREASLQACAMLAKRIQAFEAEGPIHA
jgi:integrase